MFLHTILIFNTLFLITKTHFITLPLFNFKIKKLFGIDLNFKKLNFELNSSHLLMQVDGDLIFIAEDNVIKHHYMGLYIDEKRNLEI